MLETYDRQSDEALEGGASGLEARDDAIGMFRDLVNTSFDLGDIEKWVRASPIRHSLFDDMAVGRIRWPRSLGQPDAANLCAGFLIQGKFWVDIWHVGLDGSVVVDLEGWQPGVAVELRDGTSEPDHYSVRYLLHGAPQKDNEIEVRFSDVAWSRPFRSVHPPQLYLSSHGFQFYSGGTFMTLPDITIDDRPFFHP